MTTPIYEQKWRYHLRPVTIGRSDFARGLGPFMRYFGGRWRAPKCDCWYHAGD